MFIDPIKVTSKFTVSIALIVMLKKFKLASMHLSSGIILISFKFTYA